MTEDDRSMAGYSRKKKTTGGDNEKKERKAGFSSWVYIPGTWIRRAITGGAGTGTHVSGGASAFPRLDRSNVRVE
jgi:hypothetical protein